jgi:hypothetical protein
MKITLNSHEYDIKTDENGRTVCENFNGYIHDIIQELQKDFPKLFPSKPQPKLPLAIGIDKGLMMWAVELGIYQRDLRIALHGWCAGKRYKKALEMGRKYNMRFGADRWGGLVVS